MTKLIAINKKIEALKKQADAILMAERREAISKARALVEKFGLVAEDLGLGKGAKSAKGTKSDAATAQRPTRISVAKYRHPATGKTWSGVGRAPAWIAGAKDRTKFLIDAPISTPDAQPASVAPKTPTKKKTAAIKPSASTKKAPSPAAKKSPTAKKSMKRGASKTAAATTESTKAMPEQAAVSGQA